MRDTTNPEWPSDESAEFGPKNFTLRPGGYLLVHHREQELEAEVRERALGSDYVRLCPPRRFKLKIAGHF